LRILFISNGFPPHQWAGTETYTAAIAQGLLAKNHAVQVLCGGDWEHGDRYWNGVADEVYHGVPVRRININWTKAPDPARYLYNDPETDAYLVDYLTELRPDIVHVTSCERLSASVIGVVKDAGLPLVLSLTDFWFLCPRMSLLRSDGANCDGLTTAWDCLRCTMDHSRAYQWADRLLPPRLTPHVLTHISRKPYLTRLRGLRGMAGDMADRKTFLHAMISLPDRRLTASNFVREMFVANDVTVPIELHPYGHDLAWLEGDSGKTPSDVVRIGFIGQIIQHKGLHLLLEAAQRVYDQVGNVFQIRIYGNLKQQLAYSEQLHALASALPNVEFCGTYPREQSGVVFAGLDVLVVPSLWYDFPLVIYEAFAAKTPVIATDLGGMAEAVRHDVDGLLFSRGDVDDLARQLLRIVTEQGLLPRLRKGISPVKTVAQEIAELEAIYTDLVLASVKISLPN
jgi:glycosyltransferase involved in cell wall biosynthesis